MRAKAVLALLTVLAFGGVAGCGTTGGLPPAPDGASTDTGIPFSECPTILDGQSAPPPAPGAHLIPDVTLPCFGDGVQLSLRKLAKPAVINLWAAWCGPCRQELPAIQGVYEAAGDRLAIVGVVTKDTKPNAQALAEDLGVAIPAAYDPEGKLLKALGVIGLPITLFVDASGVLKFTYIGPALTIPKLRELIDKYLGVTVEL
jgi:thiol-disulfide isomerase/thioredoxin